MRRTLAVGGLAVTVAAALGVGADSSRSGLVVHEWETFLAMNGSNGVTLDGMYHEEHALPGFVFNSALADRRCRSRGYRQDRALIRASGPAARAAR